MKFRPILFSTEMVKALLNGRKMQTRRIIKPQPEMSVMGGSAFDSFKIFNGGQSDPSGMTYKGCRYTPWPQCFIDICCPYGAVGDVLWVREAFYTVSPEYDYSLSSVAPIYPGETWYKADDPAKGPWKPSIHMPKSACRIFLKIEDIRVERLQDISEGDAIAEGVELLYSGNPMGYKSYAVANGGTGVFPYVSFRTLWQKINGRESYEANPWVWAISFTRIDKPENFL